MRSTHRFAALAAALTTTLALAACSNPESSASEPSKAPASTAAKASNDPLLGPEDAISSQDAANAEAEKSITDDNADAEMDKLEKELGEGGGGGG